MDTKRRKYFRQYLRPKRLKMTEEPSPEKNDDTICTENLEETLKSVAEKELEIFTEIEQLHELEVDEDREEDGKKTPSLCSDDENKVKTFEVIPQLHAIPTSSLKSETFLASKEANSDNNNYVKEDFCENFKDDYMVFQQVDVQELDQLKNINEIESNNLQNEEEIEPFYNDDNKELYSAIEMSDVQNCDSVIKRQDHPIPQMNDKENDHHIEEKMLRQIKRQKYVDFLSDNEDFVWSSSSWEGSDIETTEEEEKEGGKKRKEKTKKKKLIKKTKKKNLGKESVTIKTQIETTEEKELTKKKLKRINKKKINKLKKSLGEEYVTKKGKLVPAKEMKPNPCIKGKCSNECYDINEERRQQIFKYFWSLDTIRRKDCLVSNSKRKNVERKRSSELSRRTATFNYFINEGEGRKQVCLIFLIKTLDLNQKTVYNIVNTACYGSAKDDSRGKHVPANKTPSETLASVRRYIQNLPSLPSHYCRKNTTRTYLPTEFKNITNLYRLYKEKQEKDGIDFVGERLFKKVFYEEFNLGFHVPRKDKCVKCLEFENKKYNESEERKKHLQDKEETYERFKSHQVIHEKDSSILCTSFDLQKVLNTPHGESMLLYYSRKLAVYNLTFYESGTKNGYCYTWSEVDGKRGANEVSSILRKYIFKVDELGSIKHLLLYCDSCPGQNKNKINLACINETLHECTNLLSIQINYLLPGHTYMPVDSMHSVIEKSINGVIIWAPSQWPTVFCLARKSPKVYEVEPLRHTDFYKWDAVSDKYFKGNLTGKISKIRVVTFKKSNLDKILVKYSMNPDVPAEEIEVLNRNITNQLKPCYKSLLPISKKKYADLMKLCTNNTIPLMFQQEYKSLPNANNVQDTLKETDIEDNED